MTKMNQKQAVEFAVENGTSVVSGTCRFIIPLLGTFEPIDFVNLKDAKNPENAAWANQHLKGDGNDVFLINGLTTEDVEAIEDYVWDYTDLDGTIRPLEGSEVQALIEFCNNNGLEDRYCSDQKYCAENFVYPEPVEDKVDFVGFFPRKKDKVFKAVIVPVGFEYANGEKTQVANVEGALLIVSEDGSEARITNVPSDYQTLDPNEEIISI